MSRRGFTMIELLLSLAITAVVAAGVAAMLGGLATGIALGSDARTGLLATAATQDNMGMLVTTGMHNRHLALMIDAEESMGR